jgi:hypothetical protein
MRQRHVAIFTALLTLAAQRVAADPAQTIAVPQACEAFLGVPPKFGTAATEDLIRRCTVAMVAVVDANWSYVKRTASQLPPNDRARLEKHVTKDRAYWHEIIECRLADTAHPYANMAEAAADLEQLARAGVPLSLTQ